MATDLGDAAAAAARLKKDLEQEGNGAQDERDGAGAGEGVRARTHAQPESWEKVVPKRSHQIMAWSKKFEGANREAKAAVTEKELRDVAFLEIQTLVHARTHSGEAQGCVEVVYSYTRWEAEAEVETALRERFVIARKGLQALRGASALLSTNALMPTGAVATLGRAIELYEKRLDANETNICRAPQLVYEDDTRGMRKQGVPDNHFIFGGCGERAAE